MASVTWAVQALDELESIRRFVERDSVVAADHVVARVIAAVDRLEVFPGAGRMLPLRRRYEIRQILAGRYRIVYRVTGSDVRILMVRHTARRFSLDELIERF